jgi:hypothetical protein
MVATFGRFFQLDGPFLPLLGRRSLCQASMGGGLDAWVLRLGLLEGRRRNGYNLEYESDPYYIRSASV